MERRFTIAVPDVVGISVRDAGDEVRGAVVVAANEPLGAAGVFGRDPDLEVEVATEGRGDLRCGNRVATIFCGARLPDRSAGAPLTSRSARWARALLG